MEKRLPKKHKYMLFLIGILGVLVFVFFTIVVLSYFSQWQNKPAENFQIGVSFSQLAAKELELDWKKAYQETLDDLGVKNIRISSYWSVIEKKKGEYNFEETDFLVEEAEKRGVNLVVTLGVKQPRWPECHVPFWVRKVSKIEREKAVLALIQAVVERYKNKTSIKAWQVENEPFFYPYGYKCFEPDEKFLKAEVDLVRSLDSRPIILTETGELATWHREMRLSDIFGTTLYRTVYDKLFGYLTYPLNPGFYSFKSNFFRKYLAPNNQKTIIAELQAEPWIADNNPVFTPIDKQMKIFPVEDLVKNVEFAKKTSFDEAYLWGVEWWYFMKEKGESGYWEYVKGLTVR